MSKRTRSRTGAQAKRRRRRHERRVAISDHRLALEALTQMVQRREQAVYQSRYATPDDLFASLGEPAAVT